MIEDCDRQFEENIESIAKMHESASEAQAKRKDGLDDVKREGGGVKWKSAISSI